MWMHEVITHMTDTFGLTLDEAVIWAVLLVMALVGGFVFVFDLVFDVGRFLYRGARRFICRRLKVHFQK